MHDGNLVHGGATEWLYISEAGGYDFVHEGGLPIWVEAYDPKDLSTPMDVADSTQTQKGILGKNELCNWETNGAHIEQFGYIAPRMCQVRVPRHLQESRAVLRTRVSGEPGRHTLCDVHGDVPAQDPRAHVQGAV